MNRNKRAQLGKETVEIVERGWYETADGRHVDIAPQVAKCLSATRLYTPTELDALLSSVQRRAGNTIFDVSNETSLSAAQRLVVEHGRVNTLCLNFASAKNPGGGFLGGSQAQEESLARSSALYATLLTQDGYYLANRRFDSTLYTDHMILSPGVPVIRDDAGSLLPEPYALTILTAPAVNAGTVRRNERSQVQSTMAKRIAKVLALAASCGYQDLILGAWGCGVFRNDPHEVASLFANTLMTGGPFCNQFATVTFAVLDTTDNRRIIGPFEKNFEVTA